MRPASSRSRTPEDTRASWKLAIDRAEVQGGAVPYAQLRQCGLSRSAILRCRRRGHLHDRHTGVYALGRPRLGPYGEAWAASLVAGARGAVAGWFAIDRERDRELQKLGFRVLRFTWQDVRHRPRRVIRDIRAFLAA